MTDLAQEETYYALRYPEKSPNPDLNEEWYRNYRAGQLVGLDRASGGYPYGTQFFSDVKLWTTPGLRNDYNRSFLKEEFELVTVTIKVEVEDKD